MSDVEAVGQLAGRMLAARGTGLVVAFLPVGGADVAGGVRRLLAQVGFQEPEGGLVIIDSATAEAVLAGVLHRDLAYSCEVMPISAASGLAADFVRLCGVGQWSTNGDLPLAHATRQVWSPGPSASHWSPLTRATFDTGVVFAGREMVAIAWVEDED